MIRTCEMGIILTDNPISRGVFQGTRTEVNKLYHAKYVKYEARNDSTSLWTEREIQNFNNLL